MAHGPAGLLRRLALALCVSIVAGCGLQVAPPRLVVPPVGLAALNFGQLTPGTLAHDPVIVGHRGGGSDKAPENTMAAFRLGPRHGAAILECDVQCSKDGALVIIHDKTVDRTTDGKGPVRQFTLEQLKQLDAGQGERIPTLEELLSFTASQPDLGLVVEIKAKRKVCPEIADKVVAAVNKAGLNSRVMVISFYRDAVARVETLQPDLRTGLLFFLRVNPIKTAKQIRADSVWPARHRTTSHFVKAAHEGGLPVFSWTLNSAKVLLEARRVGADSVVTDVPDVAKEAFAHDDPDVPSPPGLASPSFDPEDQEDPEDLASETP
ncbi:MAG: hypothetical protein FJZ01_05185 [Candidatus Sericytochromatia bacterium]|nr:hypothetical protein [Candidatus Tanganyikabacteria bacterium]